MSKQELPLLEEVKVIKELKSLDNYLPKLKTNLAARGIKPDMPIQCIPQLNECIWGFQRRKFYVIAARPSIGKSGFSLECAYDQAMQGKRVLVLSLEMTVEDILERLFCHACGVNNQEVLRGGFNKYSEAFDKFCNHLNTIQLVISDCIGKDFLEIEDILKTMSIKPDFILIDHLNAIKQSGYNNKLEIDNYINYLNELPKKHNLVLVLCCQINRVGQDDKDKTPKLHDLKGSGNIEEAADVVMLLHWPFKYKSAKDTKIRQSDFWVIVGKNRNGPTGYINLTVYPETYTYKDYYLPPEKLTPSQQKSKTINQEDIQWEQ